MKTKIYYYKHYYRGVEMARGFKIPAISEEVALSRAKASFLIPYKGGERWDAFHRYELVSVT